MQLAGEVRREVPGGSVISDDQQTTSLMLGSVVGSASVAGSVSLSGSVSVSGAGN